MVLAAFWTPVIGGLAMILCVKRMPRNFPRCAGCDYNLTGVRRPNAVCPECGLQLSRSTFVRPGVALVRDWLMVAGFLGMFLGPVAAVAAAVLLLW